MTIETRKKNLPPSNPWETAGSALDSQAEGNPERELPNLFKRFCLFTCLAVIGGGSDLLSKEWVFQWRGLPGMTPPWWVVQDMVGVETAVNIGALFGMGAGYGWFFALASVFAAIAIVVWLFWFRAAYSLWLTVALGAVMGGIIGNLYDRLGLWYKPGMPPEWKSAVRDWILLCYGQYTWPNFNIADSLLVCGAIMLAWHSFTMPTVHESKSKTS